MEKEIFAALLEYQDDKVKRIFANHEQGIEIIGVRIGDVKKVIKQFKLKKNHKLALDLIEMSFLETSLIGFKLLDENQIDIKLLKKLLDSSNAQMLNEYELPAKISTSKNIDDFLNFLKHEKSDKYQACYYATLSCLILMDPNYNIKLIDEELTKCNTIMFGNLNRTKYEYNTFLATVGCQVASRQGIILALYTDYKDKVKIDFGDTNCKLINVEQYINSSNARNIVGIKRKTPRS